MASHDPDLELSFAVVIPRHDERDFEALTATLIETACVLPHSVISEHEDSTVVSIAIQDEQRWPHIAQRVRQLAYEYERLLERREQAARQGVDFRLRYRDDTDDDRD